MNIKLTECNFLKIAKKIKKREDEEYKKYQEEADRRIEEMKKRQSAAAQYAKYFIVTNYKSENVKVLSLKRSNEYDSF